MDEALKQWFSNRFQDLFQSQIKHYRTSVVDRLLSTFSQLEREADEFERRETERMEKLVDPEMEFGDFVEIIHARTIDYYISVSGIRQVLVNLLTVGLFHLFEQQVTQFVDAFPHKSDGDKRLFVRLGKILEDQKCKSEDLPHWELLTEELRRVANTVKHGPGDSANKLAARKPELFLPKHMADGTFDVQGNYATSPIAEEGIFVTLDDFTKYAAAIVELWDAFSCLKR